MDIETIELVLPACWASALINGDESGLEDEDCAALAAFIKEMFDEWGSCVAVDVSEPYFGNHGAWRHYDTITLGDVADYNFYI